MVIDIPAEIVNESVRRLMVEYMEHVEENDEVLPIYDPFQKLVDPEQMKKLAALNNAMSRIIRSVQLN